MKKIHAQLADTNATAIKNNNILAKKLKATETQLAKLDTTIALQSANIQNVSEMIQQND